MTILAAGCGVLIVCLGFLSTLSAGRAPTEGQFNTQVTCFVGGLVLCFLAVILSRLAGLSRRLDAYEAAVAEPGDNDPAPV